MAKILGYQARERQVFPGLPASGVVRIGILRGTAFQVRPKTYPRRWLAEEIWMVQLEKDSDNGLAGAIDRILDKGLVINADITVSVAGVELLGIKVRAAIASFETAAKYGLEFPSGTNYETAAWKETMIAKEECPQCGKKVPGDELMNECCPWCGWTSALARKKERALEMPMVIKNGYGT